MRVESPAVKATVFNLFIFHIYDLIFGQNLKEKDIPGLSHQESLLTWFIKIKRDDLAKST